MTKIQARWLASLSDGSTVIEGKQPFEELPNQPSPWLRLQRHLADNKLTITAMRVQVEIDGQPTRTFTLPSASPKSKWSHLNPLLPIRFNYFRRVSKKLMPSEIQSDGTVIISGTDFDLERFIEIHAIYPEFTQILIVDENTGNDSWSIIVPNKP